MAEKHHLPENLRELRLSGMLDTLDLRIDQAEKEKLGYVNFLELLLEDEIARRKHSQLTSRVSKAHFKEEKTLRDFDFTFNPDIPVEKIRNLATCRFMENKDSIIICGAAGLGKSHLGQSIGHMACRKGYNVLYSRTPHLLADIKSGRAEGCWGARLRKYIRPDLLIMDDFGTRGIDDLQCEDLYELIGERHLKGSTMVISNRSPKDWYGLFSNLVLGESILDRLINTAHHILMKGKSYRPKLSPDKKDETDKKDKKRPKNDNG